VGVDPGQVVEVSRCDSGQPPEAILHVLVCRHEGIAASVQRYEVAQ
jgi:hypothetical protein